MKRDWDLIRFLMLELEGAELDDQGWTEEERKYHRYLLVCSPLVEGAVLESESGIVAAHIFRLTMQGHDFLSWARDPHIWESTRAFIKQRGAGESLDILNKVANKVIEGDYR